MSKEKEVHIHNYYIQNTPKKPRVKARKKNKPSKKKYISVAFNIIEEIVRLL
jgi:hypothetical protein